MRPKKKLNMQITPNVLRSHLRVGEGHEKEQGGIPNVY